MNITMVGKRTIARMTVVMLCLVFLGWAQGVAAKDVPPKVKLTSPANHTVFAAPATITLEAFASDKDGTIKKVQFFNGSKKLATVRTAPYTFTWTNVKRGKYTLTAVATDNRGAKTTSHAVHIIVDITPAVSLTSPANGATFKAPAMITLTATAKDPDGRIAKIDFFQGTSLLATVTTQPYTFTLNGVQAGNYSFTAVATDNRGLVATSSAVNITINSGAAQVHYIYTDQLNTPRVITNQQNQVVWRWDNNDPFGANVPDEDPDGDGIKFTCNLRFPGQYFDRESNTHYNYARDYDPGIGRYVQSDPIGLRGGINTYTYAFDDPVSNLDKVGLDVTITYYPGRLGHIGIAINSPNTVGFYPMVSSDAVVRLCGKIPGVVAPDIVRQSANSIAHSQSLTIKTAPWQDLLMQSRINTIAGNDPIYNLCVDQCNGFVSNVLGTGGISSGATIPSTPLGLFQQLQQLYGH